MGIRNSDIILGYTCNNRCRHCLRGNSDLEFNMSFLEITSLMDEAKKRGVTRIIFQGGEPTIRKDFIDLVKYAKDKFENIQIQSNGRMFSYDDFTKETVDAGANDFSISIHNIGIKHDEFTRRKGSFEQSVAGIKNLLSLKQSVKVLILITKYNYFELEKIVNEIIALGVKKIQIGFLNPIGSAEKDFNDVCIELKKTTPFIKEAINKMKQNEITIYTQDIPVCILGEHREYNLESVVPHSEKIFADKQYLDYNNHRKEIKGFGKICIGCPDKESCEGIYIKYLEEDYF